MNLNDIRSRIQNAATRSGRDANAVTLVAVTKMVAVEQIALAAQQGQRTFGENYVQEAKRKIESLRAEQALTDLSFHLIGPLQSNKVKEAIRLFSLIQTVATPKLARAIGEAASSVNRVQPILVQVNISGEPSKSGVMPDEVEKLCHELTSISGIELRGLMSIGTPPAETMSATALQGARKEFRTMRKLRDDVAERLSLSLPELSMGMSDDFEVAIEEGATIVRVGSAIFGERPQKR